MPQCHVSHNTAPLTLWQPISHVGIWVGVVTMFIVTEEKLDLNAAESERESALVGTPPELHPGDEDCGVEQRDGQGGEHGEGEGEERAEKGEATFGFGYIALILPAVAVAVIGAAVRIGVLRLLSSVHERELWDQLLAWDAKYYLEIARVGYFDADITTDGPIHETTMAFFPGFPMVLRALGWTGLSLELSALLINTVFTAVMAAGVMVLARRIGAGRAGQVAAALVVTSAPMSIVFSMPYTEALFGALVVWGLVALDQRAWWWAGALGFLLSFVRLTSVDFLAVFGLWVLIYGRRTWQAWVSLIIAALPLPAYLLWAQRYLADVGGYFGIQTKHWHSTFDGGVATATFVWETLTKNNNVGYLLSVLVILGTVVLIVASWGKANPVAWWFSVALAANVLLSDGIMHSRPRLLLPVALLLVPWTVRAVAALPRRMSWLGSAAWVVWSAWFSAYMIVVFEWAI